MTVGRPRTYTDDRTSTTIRVEPELLAAIDAAADARDVSRNWLITRLLRRGLESMPPPTASPEGET